MQVFTPHNKHYKLFSHLRTQDQLQEYRDHYQRKILTWEKMTAEKNSNKLKQEVSGISRATYYRIKKTISRLDEGIMPPSKKPRHVRTRTWGSKEVEQVLQIRRENPTYGKQKIAVILQRDQQFSLSESTVGRILKYLKEKGLIQKSLSAMRTRRKRRFKNHASAWSYKDYDTMVMGERVQIDHMSVTKNGVHMKHFQAWDRRSKYIDAKIYSNAKSSSAKKFLMEFIKNAPYLVQSVQVDGGSEFMAEFEDACAELNIPLIVLPPKRPTYNGGVERGNRTFREEFYSRSNIQADSIGAFRVELEKAVNKYNEYRPHAALKGLTPMEYISTVQLEVGQSHM